MRILPFVALVLLAATSGCSAQPEREAAAAAALSFERAVTSDPAAACAVLAPVSRSKLEDTESARCATALPGLHLPTSTEIVDAEVYGHSAQVRVRDDVLFLSLFDDGWRVVAAGCQPSGTDRSDPYDCDVEGR